MTVLQEEIALKIISFLKEHNIKSKNEIATAIEADNSSSNFSIVMKLLLDEKLIIEYDHLNFYISPEGRRFESFKKLEDEKTLPIRLAESNIKANELQKIIADRNEENVIKNRKINRFNTVVAIILCLATIAQVLLLILSKE
jgi:DNA-binding transcriptional ArsR family regulator